MLTSEQRKEIAESDLGVRALSHKYLISKSTIYIIRKNYGRPRKVPLTYSERGKRKRERALQAGKCIDCGLSRDNEKSKSRCLTCLRKRADYQKRADQS